MTNDFDFARLQGALEQKDASAWIEFFPGNAEWIDYKPDLPGQGPFASVRCANSAT